MILSPRINHSNPQTSLDQRLLTSTTSTTSRLLTKKTDHPDGIDSFIPPPNSDQESSILKKLRGISKSKSKSGAKSWVQSKPERNASSDNSSSGIDSNHSIFSPSDSSTFDSDQQETDLSWSSFTLVWSRNGQLIRTFTFQEHISWAGWSWFQDEASTNEEEILNRSSSGGRDMSSDSGNQKKDPHIHANVKAEGKEERKDDGRRDGGKEDGTKGKSDSSHSEGKTSLSNTQNKSQINGQIQLKNQGTNLDSVPPFTPAQSQMQPSSHQSSSSANNLNPFSRSHLSSSSNSLVLKLVIFLKTTLILYDPKKSDMNSIDLPFPIEGGKMIMKSPSGVGILLVREEERDDRKWIEFNEGKEEGKKTRGNQRKNQEPSSPDKKFQDLSLDSETIDKLDRQLNKVSNSDEDEDDEEGETLQRPSSLAFYLRKPLDEFNGLFSYRNITFSKEAVFSHPDKQQDLTYDSPKEPRILLHEELSPFTEVDDKLIPVRNLNEDVSLRKTPQILITANHRHQKIRIWSYCDSDSRIQNFGSLKKNSPVDGVGEQLAGNPIKQDILATGQASQVQTQPMEGISSDQEYDSQLPSTLPSNFESDQHTVQKANLGRGKPPPRKSARLDKDRRSSGIGNSSMIGGPNSSINLGGRDANGRSRRLSSRISSTSGIPNNNRNVSSTHQLSATGPNFENDFNLLSDGHPVSQTVGGISRPDEFAVQQLAEDLIRHQSSQGDDNAFVPRNPSTNASSVSVTAGGNRTRRTSQSHPNQVVRPSNRARLSRASIGPSNSNTSSMNMARSASQSQATPASTSARPRLSHASSYRSETGNPGNEFEREREIKRGGISMSSLGSNGLPLPLNQGGRSMESGQEFDQTHGNQIPEEEILDLEEEERERQELEQSLEIQSFSQSFAAVTLMEEIEWKDLKDSENSSSITAHFIENPASSNKEDRDWPLIQIVIPCSRAILTREIRSEEVRIEIPAPDSDGTRTEVSDPNLHRSSTSIRYVLKTHLPSPARAASQVEALSAIPLDSTGSVSSTSGNSDLLIVKGNGSVILALGAVGGESSCEVKLDLLRMIHNQPHQNAADLIIQSFAESRGSRFTVNLYDTKEKVENQREINLDLRPWDKRTQRVLQSLDLLLDRKTSRTIRKCWIQERFGDSSLRNDDARDDESLKEDWDCLVKILAGDIGEGNQERNEEDSWRKLLNSNSHADHFNDGFLPDFINDSVSAPSTSRGSRLVQDISTESLRSILQVLHLLGQESRLNVWTRISDLEAFARLIVRLSSLLGAHSLTDYWIRLVPDSITSLRTKSASADEEAPNLVAFDIYDLLYSMFSSDSSSSSISSAIKNLLPTIEPSLFCSSNLNRIVPRIQSLLYVFSQFSSSPTSSVPIAQRVTEALVKARIGNSEIELLPLAISIPIREALRSCQLDPPSKLNAEAYRLADRPELARQLEVDEGVGLVPSRRIEPHLFKTLPRTVNLDPISAQLFADDYRLRDVAKMLQTNQPQPVYPSTRGEKSEQQVKDEISRLRFATIERTKACTIGRGMFMLASGRFVPTEKWRCPNLCLETPVIPPNQFHSNTVISQEMSELEWPMFHNGVSTALEIAQGIESMDSNWIYSHSTPESSAKHAGFLFGLGLMGHLSVINKVHGFRYLRDRHNVTTVGTLLGVAAARVGTGEPGAQSIMAVQVAAFLPSKNVDLNMSTLTQAAALMSMGILFLGSSHRWTAENMLSQIGAKYIQTSEAQFVNREAYSLSAAFALGLVMLGRGHRKPMTSIPDRNLIKGIVELMVGKAPSMFNDVETDPSSYEWSLNTSVTGLCATISLGFIFIRSNRSDISELIPLPQTLEALDEVRPDVLLVRVLAKGLIMWNSIECSEKWVESVLPEIISHVGLSDKKAPEASQLASLNTRAAACFLIGLKHAGSGDQRVKSFLLDYYRRFDHEASIRTTSYFTRVRQSALRTGSNLVAVSLAMVMAGTGDVDLLKLFRKAHGRVDNVGNFGTHVAIHMALGLLFLGAGRFTLGQSDAAIAMLVISFFPPFPNGPSDNRAHLQAYRHLWCLAVEPRLLVVEDIETKKVSYLPIKLVQRGDQPNTSTERIIRAPALVPNFSEIISLSTATERYWPSSLNVATNAAHSRKLLVTRTMQVKRRTGYLSYADDPKGFRSIFNSSFGTSDWVGIGLASDATIDSALSDLKELVQTFTTAPQHRAFVEFICSSSSSSSLDSTCSGSSNFKRFCTDVLMECLTLDKPSLIGPYLSLYSFRDLGSKNKFSGLHLQDLDKVLEFYESHFFKTFGISSDVQDSVVASTKQQKQRKPLICRDLLDVLRINTKSKSASALTGAISERSNWLKILEDYPRYLDHHHSIQFKNPDECKDASRQVSFQLCANRIPGFEILSTLKNLILETHSQIRHQSSKEEALSVIKSVLRSLLVGNQSQSQNQNQNQAEEAQPQGGDQQGHKWKLEMEWSETQLFDEMLKNWLDLN